MDKILEQSVVNNLCEEEIINDELNLLELSSNVEAAVSDRSYPPKETNATEENDAIANSIIQSQQTIPVQKPEYQYRIHLGSQPGYYKQGRIEFRQSEQIHRKIIDLVERFLSSLNISYETIKKDAFSISAWGLEPYACILLSCDNETANGVAALIGLALRQDAIGIYCNHMSDFAHPIFTISTIDGSVISRNDASILMQTITKHCASLSGQFDENGQNIELHDFENKNDQTIERIRVVIKRYFGKNNLFQVTRTLGFSNLIEKNDYQHAIEQAKFESYNILIELVRLHDYSYDKPEET